MLKIRTSTHNFKKTINYGKSSFLNQFIDDFKDAVKFFVNYLWENDVSYKIGETYRIFSVKKDLLDCPNFISTVNIEYESNLSGRAIKCASTQACGIIKATTKKRKQRLFVLNKLKAEGKDVSKLQKKIDENPIGKPEIKDDDFKCEINSICCDFMETGNSFDGFLQLFCIGNKYGEIRIPVKFHRQSNRWKSKGILQKSFLISKSYINMRWEIDFPEERKEGKIVGADPGLTTVLTLSDGQKTTECPDGHDLYSISETLCRREYEGKGFERAERHRKNYVNWSLKQLNLDGIKQINLEDMSNFQAKSRLTKHWKNTLISDKVNSIGEETGVHINPQSSPYRSQRCSECGYVNKSNRKGKIFECQKCGYIDDADLNASLNHEKKLPAIGLDLLHLKLNRVGFYWKESGLFGLNGEEFTVPHA